MEKERKITAPEGCEIEKVEIVNGAAVVTFREKKRKLPKSWEEFCEMFYVTSKECYIEIDSHIDNRTYSCDSRNEDEDRNVLPDRATAEAVLALCQLIQLRNCYNGDWVPDWTDEEPKFVIHFSAGEIEEFEWYNTASSPLCFKTIDLRDEFLRNFRPLIEKLKPLYGIKEGEKKL